MSLSAVRLALVVLVALISMVAAPGASAHHSGDHTAKQIAKCEKKVEDGKPDQGQCRKVECDPATGCVLGGAEFGTMLPATTPGSYVVDFYASAPFVVVTGAPAEYQMVRDSITGYCGIRLVIVCNALETADGFAHIDADPTFVLLQEG